LIDTPGSAKVQGVPSLPEIAVSSKPPPAARKKPRGASRILSVAVQPKNANCAAATPLSDDRPAWNGFVMVPKFSRKPADWLPASDRARVVASASRPISFAAAAAAAKVPQVAVA
jgi:hypothetical protein